jgi:hypothetical protein
VSPGIAVSLCCSYAAFAFSALAAGPQNPSITQWRRRPQ